MNKDEERMMLDAIGVILEGMADIKAWLKKQETPQYPMDQIPKPNVQPLVEAAKQEKREDDKKAAEMAIADSQEAADMLSSLNMPVMTDEEWSKRNE